MKYNMPLELEIVCRSHATGIERAGKHIIYTRNEAKIF